MIDYDRIAELAAKIYENGTRLSEDSLEFLAAVVVARNMALIVHRQMVPEAEYQAFLRSLAALDAEFAGRTAELVERARLVPRGES